MKKYVIGVDIGGRSMKFGLFTTDGELIDKSNITTFPENNGEKIIPDLIEHIKKIIEKFELTDENFEGICIGIPGPILNKQIVKTAVNLGWSESINIAEKVKEAVNFKVLVENDANVAALGEVWKGAGEGYKNLVMVTLGTGVGGGIVIDGKIVSGSTGSAGEIGHMPFLQHPLHRTCGCGGHRCFEQKASAPGIENIANDYLFEHEGESELRDIDSISAKDIFDAAKNDDKYALEIVDEYTNDLGRGLAIISAIVDPEIYVLGGGVSNAGQFLLEKTQEAYKEVAFSVTKDVKFTLAKLGNDAGIYGSAKLILS